MDPEEDLVSSKKYFLKIRRRVIRHILIISSICLVATTALTIVLERSLKCAALGSNQSYTLDVGIENGCGSSSSGSSSSGVGLFDDMADFSIFKYFNTSECSLGHELHEMEAFTLLTEV